MIFKTLAELKKSRDRINSQIIHYNPQDMLRNCFIKMAIGTENITDCEHNGFIAVKLKAENWGFSIDKFPKGDIQFDIEGEYIYFWINGESQQEPQRDTIRHDVPYRTISDVAFTEPQFTMSDEGGFRTN